MNKEDAERYAAIVKETPGKEIALNMADHVTGHHWVNVWAGLDLVRLAMEKGGKLDFFDGTSLTAEQALANVHESLETMRAEIDALKEAIKRNEA